MPIDPQDCRLQLFFLWDTCNEHHSRSSLSWYNRMLAPCYMRDLRQSKLEMILDYPQ